MRPAYRLAVAAVGIGATALVLAAVRGIEAPRTSPAPVVRTPSASPVAAPLGSPRSFAGPGFGATDHDPTSSAAQSKIWFHDDRWWAVLWEAASGELRIHVLDPGPPAWLDTGVVVDERPGSRADVLAEGDRIVVATGGSNPDSPRDAVRLVAFRYDPERAAYDLEPDFPVQLTDHGVESIVLARDAADRLWATYVHRDQLLIDRTDGDDRRWLGPFSPDRAAATRHATIVALSDRIIILSAGTSADALDVWIHRTAEPDETWTLARHEVRGLRATPTALVARAARTSGAEAVYAVAGTTLDRTDVNALAPLILLLRVGPDGTLDSSVFGRVTDRHHEPTLALDEDAGRAYVIATATVGGSRAIVYKSASLADPVFESGTGIVLAASDADRFVSTPSTPRAPVSGASGLVVLAADDRTDRYVSSAVDAPRTAPPPAGTSPTLVRDAFNAWPAGSAVGGPWRIDLDGQATAATIEVGAGADGGALTLVADASGNGPRACRSFTTRSSGTVHATVDVRLGAVGRTDGGVWLRGAGDQSASMRFEDSGTLSAYDGPTKVRSTVSYSAGAWYRVSFDARIADRVYAWSVVERDTGRHVLGADGLAWRAPEATVVDEICIDAPSGAAGSDVRVDAVTVEAR